MELKESMFREYDIRGKVSAEELNDYSVAAIASAYGVFLKQRNFNTSVLGLSLIHI